MNVTYLKTHHCLAYLTMDSWTWIHESMVAIYAIKQMQYHVRRKKYNYYGTLLTWREVKMAGYWPRSFLRFNWTKTKSRSIKTRKGKKILSFSLFSPNELGNKGFILCLVCVASVSLRFRSKERGARVKDRAKNVSLLLRNWTETLATQAKEEKKTFFLAGPKWEIPSILFDS